MIHYDESDYNTVTEVFLYGQKTGRMSRFPA